MRKNRFVPVAAALLTAAVLPLSAQAASAGASGSLSIAITPPACGAPGLLPRAKLDVVGLTSDQRLVCFAENAPSKARTIGFVAGLSGGDTALVGIDYRVQDGKLYGVGNAGGIYSLDVTTASATAVSRLTLPLSGTRFGVDFNPAADRLRIVSDSGQNLRHNLNSGGVTLNDGGLNTGVVTPPATTAPSVAGVVSAAYTNNDDSVAVAAAADTATTLLVINANTDQVMLQSPPNAGVVVATGKLGVDAAPAVGFDIYSVVSGGASVDNLAFASFAPAAGGVTRFYAVNPFTGKSTFRGSFSPANVVVDIAIPLAQR